MTPLPLSAMSPWSGRSNRRRSAVGEDAHRQHAEGATDAMDGDGADRVIDATTLDEACRHRGR